jgi:D-beta-D-heptose 7-phosphate kinase/D-beta-D-heptose 1-phosphate adenosyltransferase
MRQIFEKISSKLVDVNAVIDLRAALKKQGKKVVFTNGCFDILHLGHVTYLSKAADLGDYLIIALNNDASVRAQNKGANRPINNEKARALVLASLSFVDAIVQFEEDTPLNIIQLIQPDVLVKGADYDENEFNPESKKYIVGSQETRSYGGVVKTIEFVPNYSTTSILDKQMKS